jgi:hypothetical protein
MGIDLTSDCRGHWKCNDNAANTNVADDSILYNNDGVAYTNTEDISVENEDKPNLQRWFSNDSAEYSFVWVEDTDDSLDFPEGQDFSVCFVFKMTHSTPEAIFVNKQGSAGRGYKIYSLWSDVKLRVYLQWTSNPANSITLIDDNDFDLDTVYWVCVTFDRDGYVSLYLNNQLRQSASMVSVLGLMNPGGFCFGRSLEGFIDNVMVFGKVLTAEERDFLWNNGELTESLIQGAAVRPLTSGSLAGRRGLV